MMKWSACLPFLPPRETQPGWAVFRNGDTIFPYSQPDEWFRGEEFVGRWRKWERKVWKKLQQTGKVLFPPSTVFKLMPMYFLLTSLLHSLLPLPLFIPTLHLERYTWVGNSLGPILKRGKRELCCYWLLYCTWSEGTRDPQWGRRAEGSQQCTADVVQHWVDWFNLNFSHWWTSKKLLVITKAIRVPGMGKSKGRGKSPAFVKTISCWEWLRETKNLSKHFNWVQTKCIIPNIWVTSFFLKFFWWNLICC